MVHTKVQTFDSCNTQLTQVLEAHRSFHFSFFQSYAFFFSMTDKINSSQMEAFPLDVWRNSDHQVGSDLLVAPENLIHHKSVAQHITIKERQVYVQGKMLLHTNCFTQLYTPKKQLKHKLKIITSSHGFNCF